MNVNLKGAFFMAQAVATCNYLASDEAAMITGQTLVIDGGWTMW